MTRRIFVVDDEVMIAIEMSDTLEELGYDVVGPSVHLDDARAIAAHGDIDAALLDVNLGEGKTSEPIAKILAARSIPFAFITAYDANEIGFEADAVAAVQKPLSADALISMLSGPLA